MKRIKRCSIRGSAYGILVQSNPFSSPDELSPSSPSFIRVSETLFFGSRSSSILKIVTWLPLLYKVQRRSLVSSVVPLPILLRAIHYTWIALLQSMMSGLNSRSISYRATASAASSFHCQSIVKSLFLVVISTAALSCHSL